MAESPELIALRSSLAEASEGPEAEGGKQLAEGAIRQVLGAIENGICPIGDWERRCLGGAITSLRGGRFSEARSLARRALWPEENRRSASIAKFPARPGMTTLDELKREFAAALAMPGRGGGRKG